MFRKSKRRRRSRRPSSRRRRGYSRRLSGYEPLEHRLVLATFHVTTNEDTVDSGDDRLSLREAIIAANSVPQGEEAIVTLAPETTYRITRPTILPGTGDTELDPELDPMFGDFDIRRSMTIHGNGGSVIDADFQGRVFQISSTEDDQSVSINGVEMRNGQAANQGARSASPTAST